MGDPQFYGVNVAGSPDKNAPIELSDNEQRYLEQLNAAILYAQQAYFQALAFFRRQYGAPDGEWALNNISVGFERIKQV